MSLDLTTDKSTLDQWLGTVRQQAITWDNVDLDLCRYIASLGHNELKANTGVNEMICLKTLFWIMYISLFGCQLMDASIENLFRNKNVLAFMNIIFKITAILLKP